MANNTDTIYTIAKDLEESLSEDTSLKDQFSKWIKDVVNTDNKQNQTEQKSTIQTLKVAAQKYLNQSKNIQDLIKNINKNTEFKDSLQKHIQNNFKKSPNKAINNVQSVINKAAQMLFVETTLFEDQVNRFIDQYPIQIFVLTSSQGELGAFSYNTNRDTLNRVADIANMSLSGTTIRFNMTFEKAKQIINRGVLTNPTGKIDELLDFSKYETNFTLLNVHKEKLQEFNSVLATQTAVFNSSDSNKFKNTVLSSESRSVINDLLAASKKEQPRIKTERLKKLHNVLTQLGINFTIKQQEGKQSLSLDNVKLKYVFLKNIEINKKKQIKRSLYTKKGEINKWDEGYLTALRDAGIKGVYEYQFSNDPGSSFKAIVNQGQLKEGFFGYYYGLESGETEVNYQNQIYTVNRDSYVGYLTAMDNVKARLWGDYNIKHGEGENEKKYAISLKSENAGMDIKQFQGLATMIINKCNTSEIKNETDLKKFIIDIQRFDVVQKGHIQNSAFLKGMNLESSKNFVIDQELENKINEALGKKVKESLN